MKTKIGKSTVAEVPVDSESRMAARGASAAQSPETPEQRLLGPLVAGHLVGVDGEGRILFRPEGSREAAFPVSIAMAIADGALVKAARLMQRALVARTENLGSVLIGFVRERVDARVRDAGPGDLEVVVDGETLNLRADRQIELRCGKASLLLRADGRVILSGTYVVSTSRGPNKIKGATIALN